MKGDCKFPPVRPHFFKVILDQTLRDRKLRIPPEFVTRHGKDIPRDVLLKDPAGVEWKMEVSACNGELWLQNGWKKFAEHYSLCFGYFLVFRHDGDGQFRVIIFDKSASEIRYPSSGAPWINSSSSEGFHVNNTKANGDVSSIDGLDNRSRHKKSRERSPLPCPRPGKMMRSDATNTNERSLLSTKTGRDCRPGKTTTTGVREATGDGRLSDEKRYQREDIVRKKQLSSPSQRKHNSFQQAPTFLSENPYFIVTMCTTYVNVSQRLRIPRAFAEQYLGRKSCEVILCSSGRTWSVEYICVIYGRLRDTALKNWKPFAQDNHLRVGDVCIFELLKGRNIMLKVHIRRAIQEACNWSSSANENVKNQINSEMGPRIKAEDDPSCDDEKSASKKTGVAKDFQYNRYSTRTCMKAKPENSTGGEASSSFKPQESEGKRTSGLENNQNHSFLSNQQGLKDSEVLALSHPFFEVVLQEYHFEQRKVDIPAWFMENLGKGLRSVRLETKTGSWAVNLLRRGKSGRLSRGFTAFMRDNSVRVGDICIFDLTDSVNGVLNVSIVRDEDQSMNII